MKKPLFTGVCTALVTPFYNGKINYPMLRILLQRQIDAGITAVVLSGTTGESATLSDVEKIELFQKARNFVGNQIKIIAGTGSNNTEHSIELSLAAQESGVDGLLLVSPYYNKATPDGLTEHYTTIANAVHIPIILYNVPSRTGLDIPTSVYRHLSTIPNIIGIKEASNDVGKILQIRGQCPDDFYIWSGNDHLTVPILSLGGIGVISVISNLFPEQMQMMTTLALEGDFVSAAKIQRTFLPWTDFLSCEVNPIPIKAAMAEHGFDCGEMRLPLTNLSSDHRKWLQQLSK